MILEDLRKEQLRLESLLMSAKKDMEQAPQGSLRITHTDGRVRFRHRENTQDRSGIYIPKDKLSIAKALAQKAYAGKFIKTIAPKLDMISELIKEYEINSSQAVFEAQNEIRQQLTTPYIMSDEEFVQKWLAIPYEPNLKHPENKDQTTANGEKVRSKSEVIIADNLKILGIPYKYEAPLTLPNNITIYPDFTCLNVKRRKVIYYEHFGRMGDPEYRDRDFFWKLRQYESAGIIQGKKLIMTFEDEDHHFDFSSYKNTIEEHLLK
ncbi:hypothetical protein [Butyrivibrio sp. FCS014]|uniref:hypothetical protein n=2 Tax=Butyrivibrio sp. FCS014 TaxID=1408304 RepID=UPI0004656DDE|nr:hypothetical protein [Butyrivibrio sp. FCS014]